MSQVAEDLLNCLVVDDNYDIFPIIEMAISSRFRSVYAPDAFSAHQLLGSQHFDLLICDIRMPHLDGFGLAEELRKKLIQIPIIFISGMMDDEAVRKAFRLGAVNVISKPLNMQELTSKSEMVFHRIRSQASTDQIQSDQEVGYIYNLLKSHYYDIQGIMYEIHVHKIPLSVIRDELDKKEKIGTCHLDVLENIKFLNRVA